MNKAQLITPGLFNDIDCPAKCKIDVPNITRLSTNTPKLMKHLSTNSTVNYELQVSKLNRYSTENTPVGAIHKNLLSFPDEAKRGSQVQNGRKGSILANETLLMESGPDQKPFLTSQDPKNVQTHAIFGPKKNFSSLLGKMELSPPCKPSSRDESIDEIEDPVNSSSSEFDSCSKNQIESSSSSLSRELRSLSNSCSFSPKAAPSKNKQNRENDKDRLMKNKNVHIPNPRYSSDLHILADESIFRQYVQYKISNQKIA